MKPQAQRVAISPFEVMILGLLEAEAEGAYGSDLVQISEGRLKRGSVYTLLGRLEKRGLVKAIEQSGPEESGRTLFKITNAGSRARVEFANFVGLPFGSDFGGATA